MVSSFAELVSSFAELVSRVVEMVTVARSWVRVLEKRIKVTGQGDKLAEKVYLCSGFRGYMCEYTRL